MISKILVAYDASTQAEKAFDFALDMAGRLNAELLVCAVATLPEPPVDVETKAILEHATEFYESRFAGLAERAARERLSVRCEIRTGHPAEQIILLAEQEDVQMIVMGHRGNTMVQKWMVGSVCKRVINYAHCTVSVVR
jgi:nucleotide-binding universal stress UspA family protein